ncbi:MAG: adenosylmethionine decarboxylase [Maricaulaceae bacterium]
MHDGSPARFDDKSEADLEQRLAAPAQLADAAVNSNEPLDFFIKEDGIEYAGRHVIVDLWGAQRLDDLAHIETSLRRAAIDAGATILSSDFHRFQPNGGVSGMLVLAESHISIHTWPERAFAAVDVFMCGICKPERTIAVLKAAFSPQTTAVNSLKRGVTA